MAKHFRASEPTVPRIRPTEPAVRRLDPQAVADALGAEPQGQRIGGPYGPMTLYALRSELVHRRQSNGGRPGIEGTNLRAKIPLTEKDWEKLEALATSLSTEGFSPSAGQVASVLLALALESVTEHSPNLESAAPSSKARLVRELAAQVTGKKNK